MIGYVILGSKKIYISATTKIKNDFQVLEIKLTSEKTDKRLINHEVLLNSNPFIRKKLIENKSVNF